MSRRRDEDEDRWDRRDRTRDSYDRSRDRDSGRERVRSPDRERHRRDEDERGDRERRRGGRDDRDDRGDSRGHGSEGGGSDDRFKFMNPERARMLQRLEASGGAAQDEGRGGRDHDQGDGGGGYGGGGGGMRRGPPNRGEDEPPPELHSIHRGKVASIKDYGVFVEMEGRRRHGLVHISQVSGSRIEAEDLPTIVEVGEAVWVKVISLADGKVSLSMKYVSQTSGDDLDANNVELEQNAQRRKPRPGEAKRIELGAILPTICTKCGAGGHLAAECYSTGGQKYDLIPEPEGGDEPPPPEPVGQISDLKQALKILARANKDEKRKKRKHKKDKKDKKDKRDSKRHKKEKKEKKDKKDRHHKDRRSRHSDYSD